LYIVAGEVNRMGALNLSGSIGADHKGDVWPNLTRWGIDHVPFAGLSYLKGAAKYLLWFHLCEAMHPGWWERTNPAPACREACRASI
jgi:hypothetical protein